jgi:hypothetical protein
MYPAPAYRAASSKTADPAKIKMKKPELWRKSRKGKRKKEQKKTKLEEKN